MSFFSSILDCLRPKTSNPESGPPSTPQVPPKLIDGPRKTSQAGIDLIKASEGIRLTAYADPASDRAVAIANPNGKFKGIDPKTLKGDPWTVGYGHTGPEVKEGLTITQSQAEDYLRADLAKFEKSVSSGVKVTISDNQFAALVCFCYNVGPTNFSESTLLRKLNANDALDASQEFAKWNKAQGKVMPGLVTRREAERVLFLKS